MTDHLFASLAVAGLCAAVFGLVPRVSAGLLAAASALLAMAALVRSVGVVLLPILAFCTALWMKGSLAARTRAIAIAFVPGIGVFGLYIAGFYLSGGPYLGFVDMSGWNLYCRVAPIADCSRFTPPEGTAVLCEQRAPVNRPGPFGYVWDLNSTPRKEFQLGPETAKKLGQFAKEALVHQPLDYLQAVGLDLIRYIDPATAFKRAYAGQSTDMFSFRWRDQAVERQASKVMAQVYRGTKVSVHGEWLFAVYQNVFRVTGLFVCAALVLSVGGLIKAKWPVSLGIVLFGTSAIALYLIPVLTLSYHFRYGVPPETLLVFAGVLGAASIWPRLQAQAGQL